MCEVNMTLGLTRFRKLFFLLVCLAPLHGCGSGGSDCFPSCISLAVVNQSPGVFVDETATRLPAESNFAVRAAVGDVDGDNDLDVIIAPGGHTAPDPVLPQDFLLQINDGTGVFTNEAASRLPASAFVTHVASAVILGDVDGDTDLDAFVVNGSSGAVFSPGFSRFQNLLWINNGGGVFSDETIPRLPLARNSSFHAAFGDLDSDGDLDLVIGNVGSNGAGQQNRLLVNNGSGVFTDETTIRLPALPDITLALALEDLDGDSDLDIVVANRSATGSKILVNNGVGFFADKTAERFSTPPPFAGDVVVVDVNGDGSEDIIFASVSGGPLVFINSGGGDFTEETEARTPTFDNSHGIAVADVDSDGDVDVFVTILGGVNTPPTQSRLLLNDGNGFFTDVSDTNLPTVVGVIRYVAFADINNDGDPDLYIPVWADGATNQDRLLINLGRP